MISSQRRVHFVVGAVERQHEFRGLADQLRRQAQAERQLARLKGLKADRRIDVSFKIFSGVLAATSSMSMPPAADAMKTSVAAARSSTMPR